MQSYQKATTNEVSVVVVSSLDGRSIDAYANALFKEWGIGKYGTNNGVLFLWAPTERKLRIEVGRGLESVLTNSDTDAILRDVTAQFKRGQFVEGVTTAVDSILAKLGGGATSDESSVPDFVPKDSKHPGTGTILLGIAGLIALIAFIVIAYRSRRTKQMAEELPKLLREADADIGGTHIALRSAEAAVRDLRDEAPEEVWKSYATLLGEAPAKIAHYQNSLPALRRLPEDSYHDLHERTGAVERLRRQVSDLVSELQQPAYTLDSFRKRKTESRELLEAVPRRQARLESTFGNHELLRAASETYEQAAGLAAATSPNWLQIYDLLADASACQEHVENPSMRGYVPQRYWRQGDDSMALMALLLLQQQQMQAQQSAATAANSGFYSGSSGGSSGGDSGGFGGFGGGDSGGGGSSSSY